MGRPGGEQWAAGSRSARARGQAGFPSLLLNVELELHFPFVGVVQVVERHMLRQDLAHDEDFCVSGDVEKLRGNQRVAVVGLEHVWEDGRTRALETTWQLSR